MLFFNIIFYTFIFININLFIILKFKLYILQDRIKALKDIILTNKILLRPFKNLLISFFDFKFINHFF